MDEVNLRKYRVEILNRMLNDSIEKLFLMQVDGRKLNEELGFKRKRQPSQCVRYIIKKRTILAYRFPLLLGCLLRAKLYYPLPSQLTEKDVKIFYRNNSCNLVDQNMFKLIVEAWCRIYDNKS